MLGRCEPSKPVSAAHVAGSADNPSMQRSELAALIDYTILTPEATAEQVAAVAAEAVGFGCASVCVTSARVPVAAPIVRGSGVEACTVIGFPSGSVLTEVKVAETARAVACGASEFDMVIDYGRLIDGDYAAVREDIAKVRAVVPVGMLLKVILETSALTDEQIVTGCLLSRDAGADFVKTSTGFHPTGGATVEAVRLMAKTVPDMDVKASGGIRDLDTALAMLDAGATRLGLGAGGARVLLDASAADLAPVDY